MITISSKIGGAIEIIFTIIILSLVLGQILGQPLLLSFVTSGSMTGTINEGDGFVAIPSALTQPKSGDVIVFQPSDINGGELTTHRIIERTEQGFITKGDANRVSDQENGEPPVKRAQIVAVAFEVNGSPLTIPGLGKLVIGTQTVLNSIQTFLTRVLNTGIFVGTQGLAYLILVITILLYGLDHWWGSGRRRTRSIRRDSGQDIKLIIGAMAIAIVLSATIAMVVSSGPLQQEFVSSKLGSDRPGVIQAGETESTTLTLRNGGLVPMSVFFESQWKNVRLEPDEARVPGRTTEELSMIVQAPVETGAYKYYVTEHRYLAILPHDHLRAMYRLHPWLPILGIDLLLGVPFYIIGISLVGTGRVRKRAREGPSRLHRFVSRLK